MRHESNVIELSAYRAPSGLERASLTGGEKTRGGVVQPRSHSGGARRDLCHRRGVYGVCAAVFHNAMSAAVSG